jgi:hypothetical protein
LRLEAESGSRLEARGSRPNLARGSRLEPESGVKMASGEAFDAGIIDLSMRF